VPTGMLYGSVVEYADMSVEEMQSILVRPLSGAAGAELSGASAQAVSLDLCPVRTRI
jgi:hypothetical protein